MKAEAEDIYIEGYIGGARDMEANLLADIWVWLVQEAKRMEPSPTRHHLLNDFHKKYIED